ncbi:hypothetical protein [Flavobacterium johnsoniae]|uniref:HEPN AbiU2-like domain-containing protein n=1 Tax=Flavobacterium johnsoniae TaxID=986 RepID=A0A1J7BSZ9_FLAJO|nr:hypothetical protein [Flavobacterium johnsoniae]OIV41725.1 hypothetical protein BKM63_14510 [Flavobacterium johnsoniae]
MQPEELSENLKSFTDNNFIISEDETQYLNSWTNLSMQILEAEHSLRHAKSFNEKHPLDNFEEFVLAHGMFKNSILSYAKCFSSSGPGKVSLDANAVFKDEPLLNEIHCALMDMRNEYIAHNGKSDFELALIFQKKTENEITLRQTITFKSPSGDYEKYFNLFDHCTNYIIQKVNKKLDKLQERLGIKINFG